jgi:Superinfection immunity protein
MGGTAVGSLFVGFILLGICFFVYFLPTFFAFSRNHHNRAAILVLNLFLGWTFIGWVIALVWAFTAVRTSATLQ